MKPGFIFLFQTANILGLSLLLYLFAEKFEQSFVLSKATVIKYNVPSDEGDRSQFSGKSAVKFARQFNYRDFQFTGEERNDNKSLLNIRNEIRWLSKTNNKHSIIRIYLPNNITYGRFISLLSLMKEKNCKQYFEYDNYFYIIGIVTHKPIHLKMQKLQ